jgi:hypothetical protein
MSCCIFPAYHRVKYLIIKATTVPVCNMRGMLEIGFADCGPSKCVPPIVFRGESAGCKIPHANTFLYLNFMIDGHVASLIMT